MLWLLFAVVLSVEPQPVWESVDLTTTALTEKQSRIFEHIKAMPTTIKTAVIKPKVVEFTAGQDYSTEFFDRSIVLKNSTIRKERTSPETWTSVLHWKDADAQTVVLFINEKRSLAAFIEHQNKLYTVHALGDGLSAVVEVDQTKFKDHKEN